MDGPAIAEQVNREPVEAEPPPQHPLAQEQLYRLEAIAAQMMAPLLDQAKDVHLDLEQAAYFAVELAFHVMNKARDCRIIESKISWLQPDGE